MGLEIIKEGRKYLGLAEGSGKILQFARELSSINSAFKTYQSEKTAWCSLFLCYIVWKANYEGLQTNSEPLWAQNWAKVGQTIESPEVGCIFFYKSKLRNGGHTGVVTEVLPNGTFMGLSGNSSNKVTEIPYSSGDVPSHGKVGFRRLTSYNLPILNDAPLPKKKKNLGLYIAAGTAALLLVVGGVVIIVRKKESFGFVELA